MEIEIKILSIQNTQSNLLISLFYSFQIIIVNSIRPQYKRCGLLLWQNIMAKYYARQFYDSAQWKQARSAYIQHRIQIDGGLCEVCHKQLGYIVHHKVMITADNINNPDILCNPDYFRYECKDCHDNEEGHFNDARNKKKNNMKRDPLRFDDNGQPIKK